MSNNLAEVDSIFGKRYFAKDANSQNPVKKNLYY